MSGFSVAFILTEKCPSKTGLKAVTGNASFGSSLERKRFSGTNLWWVASSELMALMLLESVHLALEGGPRWWNGQCPHQQWRAGRDSCVTCLAPESALRAELTWGATFCKWSLKDLQNVRMFSKFEKPKGNDNSKVINNSCALQWMSLFSWGTQKHCISDLHRFPTYKHKCQVQCHVVFPIENM